MFVRRILASVASGTLLCLAVAATPAEAALKTVVQQAKDMRFSDEMLSELGRIFRGDELGVGRIDEPTPTTTSAASPVTTRTVRMVKTRQVACAVTDDELTPGGHRRLLAKRPTALRTGARGVGLFTEESRDLESRLNQELTGRLKERGYQVQALNLRLESLTSIKVVLLATLAGFAEGEAREKLSEVRSIIEQDVLKSGYPNLVLTRASSFTLASSGGPKILETSAMLFELDRADFSPTVRERVLAVPAEKPAASATVQKPHRHEVEKHETAPPAPRKEPTAVSIPEKEKVEKAQQQQTEGQPAAGAEKPVSKEVEQKVRQETITPPPSEADFQD